MSKYTFKNIDNLEGYYHKDYVNKYNPFYKKEEDIGIDLYEMIMFIENWCKEAEEEALRHKLARKYHIVIEELKTNSDISFDEDKWIEKRKCLEKRGILKELDPMF